MKNLYLISVFVISIFFVSCKKHVTTYEILKNSQEVYSNLECLSVESSLDFKWLSDLDTSHYYKKIYWIKNSNDTLYGVDVLSEDSFGIKLYRHTHDSVYTFTLKKKDSTYNEEVYIGWQTERMSLSQAINAYKNIDNDTIIKTRLEDEKVDNKSCYVVQFDYPDEGNDKDHWIRFYIDKDSFLPLRIERHIFLVDLNSYEYTNLEVKILSFEEKEILGKIQNFEIPSYFNYKKKEPWVMPELLEIGSELPNFTGLLVGGDSVVISDYIGHFLILDFWYIGCYYCVKAMPFMEKLKEYYGDKITILGINNNDKNIEQLKEFIQFKEVTYSTIIVDQSVPRDLFNIYGFPTMCFVNEEGVIVEYKSGYRDSLDYHLIPIIDSLLSLE
ncbi:MAG: redoxin domain-containing protein [Flavobacteriales bacterium]|mgnify:FL=1|jgi:thiol-disulfide isomerase/thioredoxin|nr:redoxin domain-containing protein [Flavobacteriales bacterium]